MKNIQYFKTRKELEEYIYDNLVTSKEFRENEFYQKLIKFIVNERAPIFFEQSEEYELAHFTQYFNYSLLRKDYYNNRYIEDLYYIHDFIHMIFDNPLEVREYPYAEFERIVNTNEFVASMDTEVLTYYRIPEIRDKTFAKMIFWDYLKTKVNNPSVKTLFEIKKMLSESEVVEVLLGNDMGPEVRSFIDRFRYTDQFWTRSWYREFTDINFTPTFKKQLPSFTYESKILNYHEPESEDLFRQHQLENVKVGLQFLGVQELPEKFEEIEDYIQLFENKVFMEDHAKEYHKIYLRNKAKAVKVT